MKKRSLALLLTSALTVAGAQSAATSPATSPAISSPVDARLSAAAVSLEIGRYSGPLSSLLAAVAKAAGYELILDTDVDALPAAASAVPPADAPAGQAPGGLAGDKPVVYNFSGKPFNEVWPLLLDIYGLSYEVIRLGGQDVLRVSNAPIQRVIKLANADASAAVNQVKLFFGTPQYTETQQKDAQGNVTGTARSLEEIKLDSPTLRIVADARTNSLIVRGTNREIEAVERLAAEIDKAGAQADESAPQPVAPDPVVQKVYTVKGSPDDIAALLAAQYPDLKVTKVGKTDALVISGRAGDADAALNLLAQVDRPVVVPAAPAGPPVVQRVFQLSNAKAQDVKDVLLGVVGSGNNARSTFGNTDLSQGANIGDAATLQPAPLPGQAPPLPATVPAAPANNAGNTNNAVSPADGVNANPNTPALSIIADPRSNSLIVRGSQDQIAQIAELMPTLDVRVPTINVELRIQEISESGSRSLGLDWTAGVGNFVTKIVGGSLSALFDITQSAAGFNIGATLNALEQQGFTKKINDANVTLFSGQTSPAIIKSGGQILINLVGTQTTIQRQIDYGVTIELSNPQVSPDGTIKFDVQSAVKDTLGAIDNPNLIRLTNREAQTSIALKSGQTALLGGLLSNTESNTTQGVPFLSSLPIIGDLFKTQTHSTERSQLLLVVTANLVE